MASSCVNQGPPERLNLVSAAGEPTSVIGKIVAPIQVGNAPIKVVCFSITLVILGMDFLQKSGVILNFTMYTSDNPR